MHVFPTCASRRAIVATGFSSLMLLAALAAGCSGSGGSSSATGVATRATAPLNVYVTDDLTAKYSQVLVTLYSIDVSTDGGTTYTNVYMDSTGATIDLASLSQSAQLLSSVTLPSGTITNVRLTFSDSVSLVPAGGGGGGTTQTVTVASSGSNITVSGGNAVVTYATSTTLTAGKLSNLVADFKLASFQLTGTNLTPAIGPCDPTAFNNKQKMAYVPGTVADLVAGTSFTLDLARPNGSGASTLTVDLTSTTTITSAPGSTAATAALANGDSVQVQGTVDPTTGILTAQSVTIVPAMSTATPLPGPSGGSSTSISPTLSAVGSVQSVDTTTGDFVLQVHHGEHFSHAMGGVTVATTASTVFQSGQSTVTLSSLTAGSSVAIVGTYDPSTSTLTATNVILLPAGS